MRAAWMGILLIPLLASGCVAGVSMAAAPAMAVGTTAASGKTPVDHLVSLISGKNCSIRRNQQGLTYCLEDEPAVPVRVVCYRTLGDVSCYDRPDPFNGHQQPIAGDLGVTLVPFTSGQHLDQVISTTLLPGAVDPLAPPGTTQYEVQAVAPPTVESGTAPGE